MSHSHVRASIIALLAALSFTAGCSHKKTVAKSLPPSPPPTPTPTASIQVSPQDVQAGQAATLTWSSTNASAVQIDGLGTVAATGSQQVSPAQSTNYHLTARGQGGTADATTRLTVTPAAVAASSPNEEELFQQQVKDLYFEYDKYDLRSTDQSTISMDAAFFKQHPNLRLVIEGHCDERGSEEYNMALGDNRAQAARKQLIALGVDAARIKVVSYGKEKPFCSEGNEQCFQLNRRAHFTLDR